MSQTASENRNFAVQLMSKVLAYINCACLILVLASLFYKLSLYIYHRIKQHEISSKPGLLTLIYVGVSDILIFITSYWWFIKICLLFTESTSDPSPSLHALCICWSVFASLLILICEPFRIFCLWLGDFQIGNFQMHSPFLLDWHIPCLVFIVNVVNIH